MLVYLSRISLKYHYLVLLSFTKTNKQTKHLKVKDSLLLKYLDGFLGVTDFQVLK